MTDRDLLLKEVKAHQGKETELKIKAAIGFRHVTDMLSSEGKLIVGHNCFLDLAHVYSKFVGPLPSTIEEFTSAVRTCFPNIIDTKVLLTSGDKLSANLRIGSTSLSKAFSLLCPPVAFSALSSNLTGKTCAKVEIRVDDQRISNWKCGTKHEAGFDALMTGCIFSQACFHLGINFSSHGWLHSTKLQSYTNLIYLRWAKEQVIDLKTGKSPAESLSSSNTKRHHKTKFEIVSSNIILLWGLPSKLKAKDIRACFIQAFGASSITALCHLDESAVIMQFKKAELVPIFHELIDILERDNGPTLALHPLSKILEGGRLGIAGYETYKAACCSPVSGALFADQVAYLQWNFMKTKVGEGAVVAEKLELKDETSEKACVS